MKSFLIKTIDELVRGMAYWIAYTCAVNRIKFTEAEAVGEMIKILQTKMPVTVKIEREVYYKSVCPTIKGNKRADLGIFIDGDCKCLIEVKLSENSNGGFKEDIKKLSQVKQANCDIDCYVILLYRNSCSIDEPKTFVAVDGKALKRTLDVKIGNVNSKIRVRRTSNAMCSPTASKMKKVVCFEIL